MPIFVYCLLNTSLKRQTNYIMLIWKYPGKKIFNKMIMWWSKLLFGSNVLWIISHMIFQLNWKCPLGMFWNCPLVSDSISMQNYLEIARLANETGYHATDDDQEEEFRLSDHILCCIKCLYEMLLYQIGRFILLLNKTQPRRKDSYVLDILLNHQWLCISFISLNKRITWD